MILGFSGCEKAELWVTDHGKYFRCRAKRSIDPSVLFTISALVPGATAEGPSGEEEDPDLLSLCRAIIESRIDPSHPGLTAHGSYWTGDAPWKAVTPMNATKEDLPRGGARRASSSTAIFPIRIDHEVTGLLALNTGQKDFFTPAEIKRYEDLIQLMGIALAHRRAQLDLRERIKELTCLFGIAHLVAHPGISLDGILQGIARLIPPAWLYPEIATARIILDGRTYETSDFREGVDRQSAEIVVNGVLRGRLDVFYTTARPELDDGPFMKEERVLLDMVAREIATIVQRKEAEEAQARLEEQLRHADRLATIGQLAAGVAHELNEPLGNILGFAQLARKSPHLPKQAEQDIEKIRNASLHAREIVRNLLLFARQVPPQRKQINLNTVVEEGLYFFESRLQKEGVELVRSLAPDLPEIDADPAQLNQVLVNLVINALQAMPKGGRLTIRTAASPSSVSLLVEDTGVGISDEVRRQIFTPFFTTKDIGQGTGLGLPVVHGIVSAHGGSIQVRSQQGRGAEFEIQLPVKGGSPVTGDG